MPKMTVCMTDGCPTLIPIGVGRCETHARPKWQNPSRHTLNRPSDWWSIRGRVLRRDKRTCQHCGQPGGHVDHIVRVADGGSWEESNLATLCPPCHATKTRAEMRH